MLRTSFLIERDSVQRAGCDMASRQIAGETQLQKTVKAEKGRKTRLSKVATMKTKTSPWEFRWCRERLLRKTTRRLH